MNFAVGGAFKLDVNAGEAATYTVRAKSADGVSFRVVLPWYGASGGDGILDEVYGGGTERFNYSVSRWYSNWQPPSDVWINLYFAKLDLPDNAWWSIYEDRSPYDEVDFDDWEPLQSGNGHQAGPEDLISIYLMGSTRLQNSKFFLVEHGKPLGSITVELGGQTLVLNADGSLSGFGLPAGMNFAGANSFVRFEIDSLVIEVVTELAVNVLKAAGVTVPIGTPVTLSNGTTILLDAAGNVEVVTTGGYVVKGNIHTKGGSIVGPSASGVPGAGWGIEVLPNGTTRIIAPVGASAATQVLVRAINAAGKVLQEGAGAVWVLKDILGNTSSIPVGSGSLQVGVNSSGAVQLGVQVGEKPPVWFYFGKPVMRPDTDWSGDIGEFEDTSVSRRYILVPNEGDENAAIPGDDAANLVVDGQADVDDFHPVMLDLRAMLVNYPEGGDYTYRLWHAESALNFVYTRLNRSTAFDYLTDTSATYGPSRNQPVSSATVVPITAVGVDLNTDFLRDIREQDKGVILVEAKHWTEQPLVLDVLDGNDLLDRVYLHIGKMGLSVDANRDGDVDFGEIASSAAPFRFWINNDDDSGETDHINSVYRDCNDDIINSIRDLEDFTRMRLFVGGLHDQLIKGEIELRLSFQDIGGSPSIQIWKNAVSTGGLEYLENVTVAEGQISGNPIGRVQSGNELVIPASFWAGGNLGNSRPHADFIFEGCVGGTGRLIAGVYRSDGTLVRHIAYTWVKIMDIKSMYERVVATTGGALSDNAIDYTIPLPYDFVGPDSSNVPQLAMGWESGALGYAYEPDPAGAQKYFIYVHGWRWSPHKSMNRSETVFKRMWHLGYDGRFVAFRWPTFYGGPDDGDDWIAGLSTYNDSEYRAWKSGKSLRMFVNQLPPQFERSVVAHSMGNIVAGSALRDGMSVLNYIMLNAAVPAICYDERPVLHQPWGYTTPNDDPDVGTQGLSYAGKLKTLNTNVVNFYLPNDSATTTAWEVNNDLFKPQNQIVASCLRGYTYSRNSAVGAKLYVDFCVSPLRYLIDEDEVMAFACQSLTKTVGADGRAQGPIGTSIDMDLNFGFADEHGAQWDRGYQQTRTFYQRLMIETGNSLP